MSKEVDRLSFVKAVIDLAKQYDLAVVVGVEDRDGARCGIHGGKKEALALTQHLQICLAKDPDFFEQP